MSCVEVEYNGIKYPSINALADVCGKPFELLYSRIVVLKWDVDKAVTTPLRVGEVFEYKGVKYYGLKALSEFSGISYAVLYRRIKNMKWSVDRAVSTPVGGSSMFEYNNVKYSNLHAVARATGVSYTRLYDRVVAHGWDLVRAIETPPTQDISRRVFGAHKVEIGDKVFESKKLACLEYGVSYETVRKRMIKYNLSFEDALVMEPDLPSALRENVNIKRYRQLSCGKYILLMCSVCGKSVLLPVNEAKSFEHSDKCTDFEWREY